MVISACLLFASGLAFLGTLAARELPVKRSSDIRNVVQSKLALSINDFSFDLYRKIGKSNVEKNVVLSPVSISIALAMVHAGAGGETKSQIARAMHLDDDNLDDETINEGFKDLIQTLSRPNNNYTLRMANGLFHAHSGHEFNEEYFKITKEYYKAMLEALDFEGDPSGSRKRINNWVAKMTSNKIKELLAKDSITEDTVLVLVNAVYLKASWLYKFHRTDTAPQTFHLSNTRNIKVQMMNSHNVGRLRYTNSTELSCQILELPYVGDQISMFVFLPHEIEGLSSLEGLLGAKSLGEVFRTLEDVLHMDISLPKFVFAQELDLKKTLPKVGIKDLFDPLKVDLSGIDIHNHPISRAVHKAHIVVNEEGTEGAAATAFALSLVANFPSFGFRVDRPFMFLLVEKNTGSILFLGRMMNPPKAN